MGRVCQGFLQCLLKLLNFLLILIGIAIIFYSFWMLTQWNSRLPEPPSASPTPAPELKVGRSTWMIQLQPTIQQQLLQTKLPAPWFIYAFFGVGAIVLVVTCTGHIAAETASGCCLCCYTFFLVLLLLAQAGLAGTLIFYKNWEKAIPEDPTGEFGRLERFIKENLAICKWVALGVVIIEALSLFLAIVLRSVAAGASTEYDSDEGIPSRTARQPLLNRQATQPNPTPAAPAEGRPPRNDAWSTRMRERYGLNTADFTYNPVDPQRPQQPSVAPAENKKVASDHDKLLFLKHQESMGRAISDVRLAGIWFLLLVAFLRDESRDSPKLEMNIDW